MFRRILTSVALLSAFGLFVAAPAARGAELSHVRIVRLSYTAGDVQWRVDGGSSWQKAVVNTPLREGMELATRDGRAEVEFENGAIAWMASNTVMELSQLALDDGAKLSLLTVMQGTATFYVNPDRDDSFAVQAGQLQIHPPGKARFRVDVFDDGASVSVMRGTADVDSRDTTFHVNSKRTLAFHSGEVSDGLLEANPHGDAWDRWVSDRDSAVEGARANTSNYLDSPFGYGLADLSFYGGWVNLPGYGYGWQPYGVGLGWSPFYNGYWSNFGGFGPTWVSAEPWGWVPYHYGGWVFSPGYGWVWAPTNSFVWSPATVAFVRTPTGTIGWVPRNPRETTAGTPVNMSRALVTNSAEGIASRSANSILRGSATAGSRPVSEAGDAALVRFSQQATLAAQSPAAAAPRSFVAAQRMPAGGAPRNAGAGLLGGAVPRYQAPSIFHSGHGTTPGGGFSAPVTGPSVSGNSHTSSATTSPAGGGHSGGAISGGGGGHGKP